MNRAQVPDLLIIDDDDMLQRRLERMLTSAIRRQLWITFLDDEDRETGVIIPCDDYPNRPDSPTPMEGLDVPSAATVMARSFAQIMRQCGFASLIAVWERRGDDTVRAPEQRWAAAFAAALRDEGVVVRAQFLLHSAGLRQLAPDDLLISAGD